MTYLYQSVDRIPDILRDGVVYHTEEFELAGLLYACGCGHRVILLVPDSHQVWDQNGLATVRPSIGVFDAPCKSHYFITAGVVEWLPASTGAQAASIMHAQIARHVARDVKPPSWLGRLKGVVLDTIAKLKALFGG
jgi:Family of unknown function (DUF6527)